MNSDTQFDLSVEFLNKSQADTLFQWAQQLPFQSIKTTNDTKNKSVYKTVTFADTESSKNLPIPNELKVLFDDLKQYHDAVPNYITCNMFQNGNAFTSFDENIDNVEDTHVCLLSVGEPRELKTRFIEDRDTTITILLKHGSLCSIGRNFKYVAERSVPKRKRCKKPYIQFSFCYKKQ